MPRRRRPDPTAEIRAEINVTSLVDVALVLLIIFIITAPTLTGGVEVSVPRAQAAAPLPTTAEGLVVTVDRDGGIFIGDAPVRWEEFATAFPDAVRAQGARSVYVKADRAVRYGRVVQVLGAMRAADVATVGLVAEPEPVAGRVP